MGQTRDGRNEACGTSLDLSLDHLTKALAEAFTEAFTTWSSFTLVTFLLIELTLPYLPLPSLTFGQLRTCHKSSATKGCPAPQCEASLQ